jgi:hypothetical protein
MKFDHEASYLSTPHEFEATSQRAIAAVSSISGRGELLDSTPGIGDENPRISRTKKPGITTFILVILIRHIWTKSHSLSTAAPAQFHRPCRNRP